jgi:hypothetical protein
MQPWQIKALELETSMLKHLDGFIDEHALCFLIAAIYLLLALVVWVLADGLRRRLKERACGVTPVIIIELPAPRPRERDEFDPFPPPRDWRECDCREDDWN